MITIPFQSQQRCPRSLQMTQQQYAAFLATKKDVEYWLRIALSPMLVGLTRTEVQSLKQRILERAQAEFDAAIGPGNIAMLDVVPTVHGLGIAHSLREIVLI